MIKLKDEILLRKYCWVNKGLVPTYGALDDLYKAFLLDTLGFAAFRVSVAMHEFVRSCKIEFKWLFDALDETNICVA